MLIEDSTEPWTKVMPDLATQLDALSGYHLWVVGGAVRDLLLGTEPDGVDDLDVAGTTPPALPQELLRRRLETNSGADTPPEFE